MKISFVVENGPLDPGKDAGNLKIREIIETIETTAVLELAKKKKANSGFKVMVTILGNETSDVCVSLLANSQGDGMNVFLIPSGSNC